MQLIVHFFFDDVYGHHIIKVKKSWIKILVNFIMIDRAFDIRPQWYLLHKNFTCSSQILCLLGFFFFYSLKVEEKNLAREMKLKACSAWYTKFV